MFLCLEFPDESTFPQTTDKMSTNKHRNDQENDNYSIKETAGQSKGILQRKLFPSHLKGQIQSIL